MDQLKIGRFIAACRKEKGLTQAQLAEKLGITDKAVSKWERGIAMPDSSIMLQLCDILGISVNDLLCGERVSDDRYQAEMERNLVELAREKQAADRRLLGVEIVLGVVAILPTIAAVVVANLVPMEAWKAGLTVGLGVLPLVIATPFAVRIEQKAGYYRCAKCGYHHVPRYSSVFLALHAGTTRYLRCPKCGKYSWQKKVLSKE